MIIIGDKYISSSIFNSIDTIDDIKDTKPNTVVLFDFNKEIMSYCSKNSIEYAIRVETITHAIYANGMNARYILPPYNKLSSIQKIAENYMFDSKILATIKTIDEIEAIALKGIDGVVFI